MGGGCFSSARREGPAKGQTLGLHEAVLTTLRTSWDHVIVLMRTMELTMLSPPCPLGNVRLHEPIRTNPS